MCMYMKFEKQQEEICTYLFRVGFCVYNVYNVYTYI